MYMKSTSILCALNVWSKLEEFSTLNKYFSTEVLQSQTVLALYEIDISREKSVSQRSEMICKDTNAL